MTSNVQPAVNADEASQPIPYVLTGKVENEPTLVPAVVGGARIYVECPNWCVVDHGAENLSLLEDLHHAGPSISLPVKQYGGATDDVLLAQIVQWPYEANRDHKGRPHLSIDATGGGGTFAAYGAAGALALTDQVIAHGEALRALALKLAEVSA